MNKIAAGWALRVDRTMGGSGVRKLLVPKGAAGIRLDLFCARSISGFSRNYFAKLAALGKICVDGRPAKAKFKVKAGQTVTVTLEPLRPISAQPENIPLRIVFEDEHLLVIDKAAGMVCHPAAGNYTGTLVNALLFHFSELRRFADTLRPGLVHRLDKDTSGLLVVAKDEKTMVDLQNMIKRREVERIYAAVVWGKMPSSQGVIDLPLGRSPTERKKFRVFGTGAKEALTYYEVVGSYPLAELLHVRLGTGRTHQIRVHLAHFGHPVVGDPTYGGRTKALAGLRSSEKRLAASMLDIMKRQALHAWRLAFVHPASGKKLEFFAPLPPDMQQLLEFLSSTAVS